MSWRNGVDEMGVDEVGVRYVKWEVDEMGRH